MKIGDKWRCKQDGHIVTIMSFDQFYVIVRSVRTTKSRLKVFLARYERIGGSQ